MAQNPSDGISFYLSTHVTHKDSLGAIRYWSNLEIAFEEDVIWIKNLSPAQLDTLEVKSIPFKDLYYSKGNKLFLFGSLLPCRNVPCLLWTPIERGLPINLPAFNHNYFGIPQKVNFRLKATDLEKTAYGMITTLQTLKQYIETAPAIRLQKLSWSILDERKVIIIGTPVLPIQGTVYWKQEDSLIPAGFDFEFPALSRIITNRLNEEKYSWIIWDKNGSYFLLKHHFLQTLSIGSFKLSINN